MHSIRIQLISFIAAVLVVFLVMLNFYPITSSRDLIFEEKKSAISSQAATVASSLSGLDRLSGESVREVLQLLDLSGYSRTVVTADDGTVLYDDGGAVGAVTDNRDILDSLGGKCVFRSRFDEICFSSSYAMPVSGRGSTIGAVYLCEDDYERAALISDVQASLLRFSLIIGAVALLFAVLFSTVLLQRMRTLVRSIRIVAGGDYSHRLQTSGSDEITELGNEFNMLTERLEDTEKQRRRFVSDASHELKTPLASIRLLSDSIVQSGTMDGETMREFASDIGHEAERLQRTTEKLLDLSRLDDDVQVIPEPVDVKQVALDALVLLRQEYLRYIEDHATEVTSQLISGYNAIRDPENLKDRVANIAANMRRYHEKNPAGIRYLEGGHIVGENLNQIAMDALYPVADVTGMNEEEADVLFTRDGIPHDLTDIDSMIEGLRSFRKINGIRLGCLIHSKDYALYVGDPVSGDIREGMVYGHCMAAARATFGVPADISMTREMLNLPLSPVGVAYAEKIASDPEKYKDVTLVPSRYIERPKYTVGLGDTFLGALQMCFGL